MFCTVVNRTLTIPFLFLLTPINRKCVARERPVEHRMHAAKVIHAGNIESLKRELVTLAFERANLLKKLELNAERTKFVKQSIANTNFSLKHLSYFKVA